jgi:hypothetical protein
MSTTSPAGPDEITTTAGRSPLLKAAVAGAGVAALVNAALWAAGRAADVSFLVSQPQGEEVDRVGVAMVVSATLVAFAIAWGLLALAARRGQASQTERDRPRFLPWELNVEGHLALRFRAPRIAWEHLNRTRLRTDRMSAPAEAAYLGREVGDLARAPEVFEIHPDQCGVALYVTDELISVQLTPHPHDYRLLHPSLLLDLFGETLYTRGLMTLAAPSLYQPLRAEGVRTLADLRRAVTESRAASVRGHDELMLSSLTTQHSELSRRGAHGDFTLFGFRPAFTRDSDQHVGEAVTGPDGRTAYLSSFRLSPAQVRRGHLLRVLDENEWRTDLAARALGTGHADLLTRLERNGLDYLLNPDVLLQHRSARMRAAGRRTP